MTEKRVTLQCFNCPRTYTLYRAYDVGQAKIIVECPYCGAEGEVELAPYRDPSITIQKGGGDSGEADGTILNLPDILPTKPRQKE